MIILLLIVGVSNANLCIPYLGYSTIPGDVCVNGGWKCDWNGICGKTGVVCMISNNNGVPCCFDFNTCPTTSGNCFPGQCDGSLIPKPAGCCGTSCCPDTCTLAGSCCDSFKNICNGVCLPAAVDSCGSCPCWQKCYTNATKPVCCSDGLVGTGGICCPDPYYSKPVVADSSPYRDICAGYPCWFPPDHTNRDPRYVAACLTYNKCCSASSWPVYNCPQPCPTSGDCTKSPCQACCEANSQCKGIAIASCPSECSANISTRNPVYHNSHGYGICCPAGTDFTRNGFCEKNGSVMLYPSMVLLFIGLSSALFM